MDTVPRDSFDLSFFIEHPPPSQKRSGAIEKKSMEQCKEHMPIEALKDLIKVRSTFLFEEDFQNALLVKQ